jgi:hypothetical protein
MEDEIFACERLTLMFSHSQLAPWGSCFWIDLSHIFGTPLYVPLLSSNSSMTAWDAAAAASR